MLQCGAHHSALLNAKGQLYLWGAGEVGQLGNGARMNENKPSIIRGVFEAQNEKIEMIACGFFHTIVMTTTGRVFQSGQSQNEIGEIFIDSVFNEVQELNGVSNIKAKEYSVALTKEGKVFVW